MSNSLANVAMSPTQNHGPAQRGWVWSNQNSASAMVTAASGMIEAEAFDGRCGSPGVKIAVSSAPFAALLRRGDLTHLEWLEACACRPAELPTGVVARLERLFPRTDYEYVAQVKKIATDLGLVPLALDLPGLLDPELPEAARADALGLAAALGVALVGVTAGPPGELPPETFARTVAAAKAA